MNRTSLHILLVLALNTASYSCTMDVKDYLNFLSPRALRSLIKHHPIVTSVGDEVIKTYLGLEARLNDECGQSSIVYYTGLCGYEVMRTAFLYSYLSNKPEFFKYGLISALVFYGLNYTGKNNDLSAFLFHCFIPNPSSKPELAALQLLEKGFNSMCAQFSLPLQLVAYGLNAYIYHAMLGRDNSTWEHYIKNLGLACAGYWTIHQGAEYTYKAYKSLYYKHFALPTQLARRFIIEEIICNKCLDANNMEDGLNLVLAQYAADKDKLSVEEKKAILQSPYKRFGSFENYLKQRYECLENGKNILEAENQRKLRVLWYLKVR